MILTKELRQQVSASEAASRNRDGFVYVIKFRNYLRVGFSCNPFKRARMVWMDAPLTEGQALIDIGPSACQLLTFIAGKFQTERDIHRALKGGSWYRDTRATRRVLREAGLDIALTPKTDTANRDVIGKRLKNWK